MAAIRPRAWPNLLILEFGDALLGRNGEIAAAAGAIYRRVLARDPEFVDQMIDAGRDREVAPPTARPADPVPANGARCVFVAQGRGKSYIARTPLRLLCIPGALKAG